MLPGPAAADKPVAAVEPAEAVEPVAAVPPLSSAQFLPAAMLVDPIHAVEGAEPGSTVPVNTVKLEAAQLGNCDDDDPGPVKKQARSTHLHADCVCY